MPPIRYSTYSKDGHVQVIMHLKIITCLCMSVYMQPMRCVHIPLNASCLVVCLYQVNVWSLTTRCSKILEQEYIDANYLMW